MAKQAATKNIAAQNIATGTGRRKTAVARVFLRNGSGNMTVNGKSMLDYFKNDEYVMQVNRPLQVTDSVEKFDILINVTGGGTSSQADACILAIARALVKQDEANKSSLRANGFLTRDARMVERKKYGQRGARRKFQFSKR